MKKILLDTNMLMCIGMLKVDIFSEIERICDFRYEIVTLDTILEELKKIQETQEAKHRKAAKLALQVLVQKIRQKKVKVLESGIMPADYGILKLVGDSNKDDFVVGTQDAELKKLLKEKGVPILSLRQKKYLIISGV